ncbi:hypothetical protein [Mycolicibacterium arseniciresistens]|uniref:Uncharacterized protein n=1 Tax=Mycolicibacterium arseniciresistens TaxID=3062257 RepID=A0ABT8UUK6_9MYCO|nr:hypothetical protein [Mycolicibacterium arseniciresistens]MDO3639884.1 hypothetical protein [Mycolicibacterium arseniciresistens]
MIKKIAAGAMLAGLLAAGAVVNPVAPAGADPRGCFAPWIDPPGPGCLPPPGHLKDGPWPFNGPPGHWPVNPGKVNHW